MKRAKGFTLVELMVAVVIMAILAAMAVPLYQNFIATQRIKSASFNLYSSLLFARNEASHRRDNVTITPTGGNWANGWVVTYTNASSTVVDLRVQPALKGVVGSSGASALTYYKDGRTNSSSSGTTITLSSDVQGVEGRCIYIEPNGAPRAKAGSTC